MNRFPFLTLWVALLKLKLELAFDAPSRGMDSMECFYYDVPGLRDDCGLEASFFFNLLSFCCWMLDKIINPLLDA